MKKELSSISRLGMVALHNLCGCLKGKRFRKARKPSQTLLVHIVSPRDIDNIWEDKIPGAIAQLAKEIKRNKFTSFGELQCVQTMPSAVWTESGGSISLRVSKAYDLEHSQYILRIDVLGKTA